MIRALFVTAAGLIFGAFVWPSAWWPGELSGVAAVDGYKEKGEKAGCEEGRMKWVYMENNSEATRTFPYGEYLEL